MATQTAGVFVLVTLMLNACATVEMVGPDGPDISDYSRYYPSHCTVHGRATREDVVPIMYGALIFLDERYVAAHQSSFPLAETKFLPGCLRMDLATRAVVLYCPECREEEAAYLAAAPQWKVLDASPAP